MEKWMKLHFGRGEGFETLNFQMIFEEAELLFSSADGVFKIGIVKDDEPTEDYTTIDWYVLENGYLKKTFLSSPISDILSGESNDNINNTCTKLEK